MEYKNYKAEDFALDPNFRKWVLEKDKDLNEFWINWIASYPEELEEMKKARKLLLHLPDVNYTISDERKEFLWKSIEQSTQGESEASRYNKKVIPLNSPHTSHPTKNKTNWIFDFSYWGSVAAVFIITLGFVYNKYNSSPSKEGEIIASKELVVKFSPWGQKSTIFLPDGSEVILNSGSTLSYYRHFGPKKRELRLKGEAYFKVTKDTLKPFKVITENLATTALGTEFNVRAYEDEPETVVLYSGKVKIDQSNAKHSDQTILLPGEGVLYDQKDNHFEKFLYDEKEFLSWKDGILYFQNSREEEVIKNLEKWYGVKIKVKNDSPKRWGYTGEFHRKSLENVLLSIGFAMKFTHDIKGDTVIIKYKN